MKKMILVLAAMAMSIPAMAAVTLSVTQPSQSERKVVVSYNWDGNGSRPRAFALDVNIDAGTITAVTPTISGESNAPNHKGYGIFMGGINIAADGTVNSWGTPVGDTNDAAYPATRRGLNHDSLTLEMGSLYFNGPLHPDQNTPANNGPLCTITVSSDCWLTIKGNAIRGNVVLEDATSTTANLPLAAIHVQLQTTVPVPNVVGQLDAAATTMLTNASLVKGTVTQQASLLPATQVISQNPAAGTQVNPGTSVALVESTGPKTVPNVVTMTQATATTTITGTGLTLGTVTLQISTTQPRGRVLSQNPASGTQVLPGSAVNITVSVCKGDADNNGYINKADVSNIVSLLGSNATSPLWRVPATMRPGADWDQNGWVNKADVSGIVSYLGSHATSPLWRVACP